MTATLWAIAANRRVGISLVVLNAMVAATFGIAWARMDSAPTGSIQVSFETARIELQFDLLEPFDAGLLPSSVHSLSGAASKLVYDGCGDACPTHLNGVSLRSKGSALPLSNLVWMNEGCERTVLTLESGQVGATAHLMGTGGSDCEPRLSLVLAGADSPWLSFNTNPHSSATVPLKAGSTVTWHPSQPVALDLEAKSSSVLLSREAIRQVKRITGRLASPFRAAGASRTVCAGDAGDTISLAGGWAIEKTVLQDAPRAVLNVQVTSTGQGFDRCAPDAGSLNHSAACKDASSACTFDWPEFTKDTSELTVFNVVLALLTLLSFVLPGRKTATAAASPPPATRPASGKRGSGGKRSKRRRRKGP